MGDPIVLVVRWLILAAAVWAAAEILPGIRYQGTESILVVAAILALLNLYVKPVLTLLTFPITILTAGLFLIVLNAILLGLASWVSGIFGVDFSIDGILDALLGAIIVSLVSLVISSVIKPDRLGSRF